MKNIFKFMGIALIAGSMMIACGPDENEDDNATTYTITTEVNSAVMGSATGAGQYKEGETCTLHAIANAGHRFVNWTNPDGTTNTNNPYVFEVRADGTYIANFELETGVKCTFGDAAWTAAYVNGQLASNAIMLACGQTSATSYPIIKIQNLWQSGSPATGTYSGNPTMTLDGDNVNFSFGSPYVWYFESGSIDFASGTQTGDWWGKTVTMNITALDADALTVSMVVNASMAHMTDIITSQGVVTLDFNEAESRDLTVNVVNQELTQYQGKGITKTVAYMALAK